MPTAIKDTVLNHIFPDGRKTTQVAGPEAIKALGDDIVQQVQNRKIVTVTAAQQAAITGNGGAGQRNASRAYKAAVERMPGLGARRGITGALFDVVIYKGGAYKVLGKTLADGRAQVSMGIQRIEVAISDQVNTVVTYVNDRIADPSQDPDTVQALRTNFGAIGIEIVEDENKQHERALRQARRELPVETQLADTQQQQRTQAAVGKLENQAVGASNVPDPQKLLAAHKKKKTGRKSKKHSTPKNQSMTAMHNGSTPGGTP